MADLHIDANITAPPVVTIPLVREDLLNVASTFDLLFECSLALFMVVLGASLTNCGPVPKIQWFALVVLGVAAFAFKLYDRSYMKRARNGE